MKKFTIIIPIFNEVDSIFDLLDEINEEFSGYSHEILLVDDGSTDGFQEKFKFSNTEARLIVHKKNLGKCRAMETGVKNAKNSIICVMDGDGQNAPTEARKLLNIWINIPNNKNSFALVCGNRVKRKDTFLKKISSRVANNIRMMILKDECNDTACALKVFSKFDYLKIPYIRNMHRFLPALFKMNKGKIFNVPVLDRKRFAGVSKFNFNNRFWIGIVDLIKIWALINKKKERRK